MDNKEPLAEGDNLLAAEEQVMVPAIDDVICLSDLYIHKSYLQYLDRMPIVPMDQDAKAICPGGNLRLIRITGILHHKDDNLSGKIKSLFGAVEAFEAGVMLILQAKGERVDIYIGICGKNMDEVNPAFNTFIRSLKGILPGCKYYNVKMQEVNELMDEVFARDTMPDGLKERIAVSAISAFPGDYHENRNSSADPYEAIEKIDVLLDGMRGRPFSMILLAQSVSGEMLTAMQHQLELLYMQMSPYERQTISFSKNDADSVSLNYSQSVTSNQSYSAGFTHGVSHTHGKAKSSSEQETDEESKKMQAGLGLLGTAVSLAIPLAGAAAAAGTGATLAGVLGKAYGGGRFLQPMFYGSGVTSAAVNASILTGIAPGAKSISSGYSEHDDHGENDSKQITFSVSEGMTDSSGYTIGNSRTVGNSLQYTIANKYISNILQELDDEIKQIQRLGKEGAFSSAAYFIAGDEETAITAANIYRAITETNADGSPVSSSIYRWNNKEDVELLVEYLSRGIHPSFVLKNEPRQPVVEVAQIIGLKDIPVYFSFPQKSVPGMAVSEYVGFSRDIIFQDNENLKEAEGGAVHIGHVYHLGKTEMQTPIRLRVNDLTKHLFVAGATGVGKSNFCYQLLDQLVDYGIKVLIIEPAKGEYASVLGGKEGFHVFGADAMRSPMLRINPFAFPEGIQAVQHIERLLDIFNAAWTMYDAMPAILKEAIETIYLNKGFNLYAGGKPENTDFPCFDELLEELPRVIQRSSYSNEVKGNYTGALVTRVKSLTNGLYRMIFGGNEIGDAQLFGQNVIIDISRIGSSETKALIMGILIMRLSEFRMCEGKINSPLRHVTLLEEAHNLLRKSSGGTQGIDLRAASVEMITNAIAEMRTYGEGFLVADQSPSVLDAAVIRNTHTKVLFMLPDRNDREMAGDSLSLSEGQKQELARLSPGVAAVYQNGWTSAVLCKVNFFAEDKVKPFIYQQPTSMGEFRELLGQAVAVVLSNIMKKEKKSSVSVLLIHKLCQRDYSFYGEKAEKAMSIIREYGQNGCFSKSMGDCKELLSYLLPLERVITATDCKEDRNKWGASIEEQIIREVSLSVDELMAIVQCGISWFMPRMEIGKMYARYIGYRNEIKGEKC